MMIQSGYETRSIQVNGMDLRVWHESLIFNWEEPRGWFPVTLTGLIILLAPYQGESVKRTIFPVIWEVGYLL